MRQLMVMFFVIGLSACTIHETVPTDFSHGEIRTSSDSLLAWDEMSQQWVSPDVFWHNEVTARGGLNWAQNTAYPPYGKLNEFDTFFVELRSGTCLMTFYHSRWRRANDVWRWDDAFNNYSACPYVFD
jgi:hypothetical protein